MIDAALRPMRSLALGGLVPLANSVLRAMLFGCAARRSWGEARTSGSRKVVTVECELPLGPWDSMSGTAAAAAVAFLAPGVGDGAFYCC